MQRPYDAHHGSVPKTFNFMLLVACPLLLRYSNGLAVAAGPLKLHWPQPHLVEPTTIDLSGGNETLKLDPAKDYLIRFPSGKRKTGRTILNGGHHIVIVGGHVTLDDSLGPREVRAALAIYGATGTVHVESLLIDNPGGHEFDGIVFAAPDAVLQIQNVRMEKLRGSFNDPGRGGTGFHSDLIQNQGGIRELRIDGLTGSTNYQGLMIPITPGGKFKGPIGSATIRNVNLTFDKTTPHQKRGFLLWFGSPDLKSCENYPITLENVYVRTETDVSLEENFVWPSKGAPAECRAQHNVDGISWPSIKNVNGVVKTGAPPAGDFVPADGAAG